MQTIHKENLPYQRYLKLQERLRKLRHELLLFCSHPATLTFGRQTKGESSLLIDKQELSRLNIEYHAVSRGGDVTAHEIGQCVIYPHVDLRKRDIKLSYFTKNIMRITQDSLQQVWPQLKLIYRNDAPGLYTTNSNDKLVAFGFSYQSYFSSHGVAINVRNDLKTFQYIHPCGYSNIAPTSIQKLNLDIQKIDDFCSLWKKQFESYLNNI